MRFSRLIVQILLVAQRNTKNRAVGVDIRCRGTANNSDEIYYAQTTHVKLGREMGEAILAK